MRDIVAKNVEKIYGCLTALRSNENYNYKVGIAYNKGFVSPDEVDVGIAKEIIKRYFGSALNEENSTFWSNINQTTKRDFFSSFEEGNYNEVAFQVANLCLTSAIIGFWEGSSYSNINKSWLTRKSFVNATIRNYLLWETLFGDRPELLALPKAGNPFGVKYKNEYISASQIKCHYHASIVNNLIKEFSIKNPVVLDIGGGYGGVGYFLFKQGFKGTFIDVDIPKSLLIAQYFLKKAYNESIKFSDYTEAVKLEENKIILLPDSYISKIPASSVDIVINTRSFSEMPPVVIDKYMHEINRVCTKFLYHDNANFSSHKNETPANDFNIPKDFKCLFRTKSMFHLDCGMNTKNRFAEFLYSRI